MAFRRQRTMLAARLAGPSGAGGQGLAGCRAGRGAGAVLTAMGLPARRDEYWRYTDPTSLNAPEARWPHSFDASDEARPSTAMDRLKIVFVDGVFDPAASDDLTLAGVSIERLAEARAKDIHWAQGLYGAWKPGARPRWPGPLRR